MSHSTHAHWFRYTYFICIYNSFLPFSPFRVRIYLYVYILYKRTVYMPYLHDERSSFIKVIDITNIFIVEIHQNLNYQQTIILNNYTTMEKMLTSNLRRWSVESNVKVWAVFVRIWHDERLAPHSSKIALKLNTPINIFT